MRLESRNGKAAQILTGNPINQQRHEMHNIKPHQSQPPPARLLYTLTNTS